MLAVCLNLRLSARIIIVKLDLLTSKMSMCFDSVKILLNSLLIR